LFVRFDSIFFWGPPGHRRVRESTLQLGLKVRGDGRDAFRRGRLYRGMHGQEEFRHRRSTSRPERGTFRRAAPNFREQPAISRSSVCRDRGTAWDVTSGQRLAGAGSCHGRGQTPATSRDHAGQWARSFLSVAGRTADCGSGTSSPFAWPARSRTSMSTICCGRMEFLISLCDSRGQRKNENGRAQAQPFERAGFLLWVLAGRGDPAQPSARATGVIF